LVNFPPLSGVTRLAQGEALRCVEPERTETAELCSVPPRATPVWNHAGQDRSASLASGVSEPPKRSDFSDETGGEREKCWRHQSKERRFRSLALPGVAKLALSVGAGGSERWKPDRPLLSQAGRRILPVGREVKTEIPVKNGQVYVVGGPESVM